MAQIPNSIRVTGFIAPSDSTDVYATHDSIYGRGGSTEVASISARDAITTDRRREGMTVYVATDSQTYQLVGGTSNSNWTLFGNAAAVGSYVTSVNGVSGAVELVQGVGIGITGLEISVTGDYALNTTVYDVSSSLQTEINDLTTATVDASSTLYTLIVDTSGVLQTNIDNTNIALGDTSASLYTLVVNTSGNLHSELVTVSGGLYTIVGDVSSSLQTEINDLTTATVDASSTLYTLIVNTSGNLHTEIVNVSGDLYTLIGDTSATIDSNFVHRTGNVNESIDGEKDFLNNAVFAEAVTICGDLYVAGSTVTVASSAVTVADRIITVNAGEPGVGVTNLYAGLEVDRGTGAPYYMVFDELRDAFTVGTPGGPITDAGTLQELQVVATREDAPQAAGVAFWQEDGSPSGGHMFVTNASFTYDVTGGLDVNRIVYAPADATDWSVAPASVFEALDTLAQTDVDAHSTLVSVSGDLYTLIVDTSGNLHTEIVNVSGALQTAINDLSGASSTALAEVSAYLYSIDVATSGALQTNIDNLTTATVDASSTLYTLIVDTSGVLQTNIDNTNIALGDTSAALYNLVVNVSGDLQTNIDNTNIALGDTSAALYTLVVNTSGNLHTEMVTVSGNLYTTIYDTSASLQDQLDALGTSLTGSYVTLDSAQEITGAKTFIAPVTITLETSASPLTVNASGLVINFNADLLDGFHTADITAASSLYTDALIANISGVFDTLEVRVDTLEISANNHETRIDNLETSVDTISNSLSTIMQGNIECDTSNYKYTVMHSSVNVASSFPMISLTVPTSSSVLYVQGITNRTATSFDIVLSDVPDVLGYELNWTLPLSGSAVVVRAYGVDVTTQAGGSFTADAGAYDTFELNYTGAVTINPPSSMADGQTVNIIANSTATGSSLTWNGFKFGGGSAPTATVEGSDIYTILKKGSSYYVSYTQALG